MERRMTEGVAEKIVVGRLTANSARVVQQINVLTTQLKPSWAPITAKGLAAVLASPTRVYVARADDTIVGIVLLVPHQHLPGLRCHIEDVVVDERYRRRGIARELLTTAMREAPVETISFDLRSHRTREGAHDLYLRLGFEPSGTTVFRRIARRPD
jgi:ribosomal protein S18 acetylase RimI-like enzyme